MTPTQPFIGPRHTAGAELVNRTRVVSTFGALYSKPRKCGKRRRCDGHLADERHWIEPGDLIVWSALPPDDRDIGNSGWWHAAFCEHCAPIETVTP